MKKKFFYSHYGSSNHGCEALVRANTKILKDVTSVFSFHPEEDIKYGLDKKLCIKFLENSMPQNIASGFLYKLLYKLKKNDKIYYKTIYRDFLKQINKGDIAISIGGDNYCYGYYLWLKVLNEEINKRGGKTVLWGCSIEPDSLDDELVEELNRYSLITARESITYNALLDVKLKPPVIFCPDAAFTLPVSNMPLPNRFIENRTIGINISPVIEKNEKIPGITLRCYEKLISYILNCTDFNIAFIPHVVAEGNDDRELLSYLYNKYNTYNRVLQIKDCNCQELKGFISRCAIFIGARTHATIAAYSSYVPTLVIGYSVKARGIAQDLFGTWENYVKPVQELYNEDDLIESFLWIEKRKERIKEDLKSKMANYIEPLNYIGEVIDNLI